jgi:hypothetical protein
MAASNMADSTIADGDGAAAPAPAAPQSLLARWRAAGFMLGGGLTLSALIHVLLFGSVLVLSPRLLHPEPATAVTVDIVTPEEPDKATEEAKAQPPEKAQTPALPQIPDVATQPQQAQQSRQPQPAQQAQQPQPAQQPPQPAQQSPQSAAAAASPPPPPPPLRQPTLDAFAPPLPSAAAPAASPPPPPATSGQAAQLAELLGLPPPVAGLSGGPPSDVKANLTSDEIAGYAAHVQGCWVAPPASLKGANITVFIRVRLRPDGSLAGSPEPLGGSASMQAFALLQSSVETLKKCAAYKGLPADKYNEWRVLDLHFTPSGISTAAPAPSSQRKPQRAG